MLRISFHAPGKTSCKMPKMVREICPGQGKSQGKSESFFSYFWWEFYYDNCPDQQIKPVVLLQADARCVISVCRSTLLVQYKMFVMHLSK